MVFGVGVPTELTLVWLRTSGSLLFVWGFMSAFTLLAGTEFKAARAIREHFSPE